MALKDKVWAMSDHGQLIMSSNLFKDFGEYWYFVQGLSQRQRDVLVSSLSEQERLMLRRSYQEGGWEDVFMRNSLNRIIDSIYQEHDIDFLLVRCKVMNKQSVYIPRKVWEHLITECKKYDDRHKEFIIGGIHATPCSKNKNVVLITKKNVKQE
jgi:hypothetical protein